jgi:cell wall assembly regulator SMI1
MTLEASLDELDRLVRSEHPGLYERLRPGLSRNELDRLAEGLRPYYLPAELVVLYGWHDGWRVVVDDNYRLLPDAQFNSLGEAIAQYRVWWEALGSAGWHPLWFPAFGDRSGELVALQLEPDQPAGTVFSFHSDLDLGTSYDSVAALFATTLECWRAGLLPHDPSYLPPEIRPIAARLNPNSRTATGAERRTISRSSTAEWPSSWKEVLGIGPPRQAADELVVTIAEFTHDPLCGRPIRADVHARGGSFDVIVAVANDDTGSTNVVLKRDETEHFREFTGASRCELWLVPFTDESADGTAGHYLATRIVPL